MSDNLFDAPEVLSPKLAWLKKHKLTITATTYSYVCHNAGRTWEGTGETENEAILDYCERYNLKHWTLE